jgi:SAM-dependent methyltransferase
MSSLTQPVPQVCVLCRHSAYTPVKRFADGIVVGRCVVCGLLYTPRRHPEPEGVLGSIDPNDLKVLSRPIVNGSRRYYRSRNFADYLDHIERHAPGRRLLDVGCAQGFFLLAARERGYEVTGLEPSRSAAGFAREALRLIVLEGRLSDVDLGEQQWDVVTFTDSLEYLPEPLEDLRKAVAHLSPGGIVFLKVPNGDYFRFRHKIETHLGHRVGVDEAFGPSRRVVHYTASTLNRLAELAGLQCVEIGVCRPIHSPLWLQWTGLELEMEPPSFAGWPLRLARRALHAVGYAEAALLSGRNHLAQALYLIARRPEGLSSSV